MSDKQKQYAAIDAWSCINLYEEIDRLKRTGDYDLVKVEEPGTEPGSAPSATPDDKPNGACAKATGESRGARATTAKRKSKPKEPKQTKKS